MKLRESIVISCVSYTAVMIIISILNGMGISDLNWIFNLELFVVTTLISLFMYIIDKLNIESQPVYVFTNNKCSYISTRYRWRHYEVV